MNRILFILLLGLGLIYGCQGDGADIDTKPDFEVLKDTLEVDGEQVIMLDDINEKVRLRSILPDVNISREMWDFDGDGKFDSYAKEPRYRFEYPGDYIIKYCYNDPTNPANCTNKKVKVRVKGGAALAESTTPDDPINKPEEDETETPENEKKPVFINVQFKLDDKIDQGSSVSLKDLSSPSSEVNSRQWFIDGKSLGGNTAVNYTFNDPGFHSVRLCINGTSNCIRKMIEVIGKEKQKPPKIVAKMDGPREVNQGEIITFRNASTPPSYITDYAWTVNKKKYTQSDIQFTIDKPGNYTIKLCVNGNADCTTSKLRVKEVKSDIRETPVTVIINAPSIGTVGQRIEISDMSSPGSAVNRRTWTVDGKSYSRQTQNLTFDRPGEYNIKLCINGNQNCSTKKITIVASSADQPVVSAQISAPNAAKVGETVTFSDISSPSNEIKSREWTIDNKTYNGKDVSITFNSTGIKEVKLCINGSDNCISSTININAEPSADSDKTKVSVDFTMPDKVKLGDKLTLRSGASPQSAVTSTIWYVNSRKVSDKTSYTFDANKEGTFEITLEANGIRKSKKVKVESKTADITKPEDSPVTKNVGTYVPNDEDFYCNSEKSGGIPSTARCGESNADKKWSGTVTIEFTPKKRCALQEVTISTNASGSVKIKMSNGQNYIEQDEFYVNRGNSTIALEDLYYAMEPNWTYYMTITPVKGSGGKVPQLENSSPCNPTDNTDSNLKINYRNNYVIYDLKYCYE